jgi:hypothetical protein
MAGRPARHARKQPQRKGASATPKSARGTIDPAADDDELVKSSGACHLGWAGHDAHI